MLRPPEAGMLYRVVGSAYGVSNNTIGKGRKISRLGEFRLPIHMHASDTPAPHMLFSIPVRY